MAADVLEAVLSRLRGGDPFADVLAAAESHREEHGDECGLYPAGPAVMSLAATFARVSQARTILDLGCGSGYSSLWLAESAATDGHVDAVDRFGWHIDIARRNTTRYGMSERISYHEGEAVDHLAATDMTYDLIHDDAWFAHEPSHLAAMIARLRPGGVLTMPNWFLLTDAVSREPARDWSAFAGQEWREGTLRYARHLAAHPELAVNWITDPPLGVAIRRDRQ